MMKTAMLCIALAFMQTSIYAQTYDTTQYYGRMNYVFHNVNKTPITTGLLKDYGIEFLNFDNYNGLALHDSNYVGLTELRQIYTGLYSSQINNNAQLLYLDSINRLHNRFALGSQPISFTGIYYNYQSLRADAVSSNLMYISGEQLYDVANRPQSPYQQEELFAIAPIRQAAFTGANQFIFRPELFLSNTGKTISSIAVDPGATGTYQPVSFNTPFTVNYSAQGFFNFNIRLTYSDASIRYGHTKMVVYANPDSTGGRYGERPVTTEVIMATKQYLGLAGVGDITIDLAVSNTTGQIRKPLIVVEGFDPNGDFDYDVFVRGISRDLNFNFFNPITLNDGLDDINEYDLIFLNYTNGTDFIQRNAFLLEQVIERVNELKTTWNGVRQQNVIIGMSMGGLVTRYALRDMELNSQNHETRLFISHDAPHWGANVPVAAQAAVQQLAPFQIINPGGNFPFINYVDMFPDAVNALTLFNSPAAKQMLIQRYTLSGQTLTADNTVHNAFLTEYDNMGWPVNCRNVTLANGSCGGTLQPGFPDNATIFEIAANRPMTYLGAIWRSLGISLFALGNANGGIVHPNGNLISQVIQFPLSIFSTRQSIGIEFRLKAVPASGTTEIYRGDIYSKKKLLGFINVKSYFLKCHANSNTAMLPLDNAPGGIYDIEEFGIDPNLIATQLPNFFNGYVQSSLLQGRFCFVPTVSSLAINNPAQNLRTSICNNIACLRNPAIADFFAPTTNELHISYTQPATNWLLGTQDASINCNQQCLASLNIVGPARICSTGVYTINAGASAVNWTAIPNIVNFSCVSCSQTTVTRNGTGNVTLIASINTGCGTVPKTKVIHLGAEPPSSYSVIGAGVVYASAGYTYSSGYFNNPTFVTNPFWRVPTGWTILNGQGTDNLHVWTGSGGGAVELDFDDACGERTGVFKTVVIGSGGPDPELGTGDESRAAAPTQYVLAVSPNPARNSVNISYNSTTKTSAVQVKGIQKIIISDRFGILKKQYSFQNSSTSQNIQLSGLDTGSYIVQALVEGYWLNCKLIVVK